MGRIFASATYANLPFPCKLFCLNIPAGLAPLRKEGVSVRRCRPAGFFHYQIATHMKAKSKPTPQPDRLKKVITIEQSIAIFGLCRGFEVDDIKKMFRKFLRYLEGDEKIDALILRDEVISLIKVHEELENVDGMVYELFNQKAYGLLTQNQN